MGEMTIKEKIWFWFVGDILKHEEGKQYGKILSLIHLLFFPIKRFIWNRQKKEGYQWEDDTWLINGIKYNETLFRMLAFAPNGTTFKIVKREDGVITIEKVKKKK